MTPILLASRSPRRLELLQQIGIPCQPLPLREEPGRLRDIDETPLPGENVYLYVERMAKMKAQIGMLRARQRGIALSPLLAADTAVSIKGTILGKPADAEDAKRMLRLLSGTTHEVLTAVAVTDGTRLLHDTCVSRVRFRDLEEEEIARYVASREPMGKAGAYAVQGLAAAFIERIEGSYSGIMGLPLFETAALLARFGIRVV
ncbi:MAG: Maf family nucleotide pyrophosphatase [Casimicrobiaceae bacterium]|nr:Maf family nucleotide pyrophosphatase [Casimicrobiaceae bacterium]MCX8099192.1 Maf family nucleotide pyrophosphatase [Casimicrobiaceae bacterium]MDW8311434.1 Maf family protein [Burkholderiales bacterium]